MRQAAQQGFTLISAIFILVVLAALGAFAVTVSTTQQMGLAFDIQGSRAYQAARTGIEWGTYQVQASTNYQFGFGPSPVGANPNTTANGNVRTCPTSPSSFALPATATTLADFTVTVTCTETPDPGGFGGPTVFTLQSTACNQPTTGWSATSTACPNASPSSNYIERRIEVSF